MGVECVDRVGVVALGGYSGCFYFATLLWACGSEHLCNLRCEPPPIWVIPCIRF